MNYNFSKEQKEVFKGSNLWNGIPMNRNNCLHVPELVLRAHADLKKAQGMPHATPAQIKAKDTAVAAAKQKLDERQAKLDLYKEIFPDLFLNQ
jgi:hypothetical protein